MENTEELERFESWIRSHFLMHHEWLKQGQGKWRYAKNETLFMWDAWKARAELTPNVELTGGALLRRPG